MTERVPIQKEFGEVVRSDEKIEIKKFGTKEVVGYADLQEAKEPSHYLLSFLKIKESQERGKGFASQLMKEAELISRETGKPIVLCDEISSPGMDRDHNAIGMYGKRSGWVRLRSPHGEPTHWYVYGPHDSEFSSQILKKYEPNF